MDYLKIYTNTFSDITYSNQHHPQYDYAIDEIQKITINTNIKYNLIDIGSGRGQLINLINLIYTNKFNITSVDLDKFNDMNINFIKCDLSIANSRQNLTNKKYDILTCTDVFEHLDKSFIEDVIIMCSKLSENCIFAIANHSDIQNNIELHTIQENDIWWDNYLLKYFNIIEKQNICNNQLYMYTCKSKHI